jgi:sugar (pentulose or hexulose) kinase
MNNYLGIELGSTRIKAVLIDSDCRPIASGGYDWENRYEDGVWTYSLDDVWTGLRAAVSELNSDMERQGMGRLTRVDAIGISAMMHGYLAFGANDELLVPFRTWRNTMTEAAAARLSEEFSFNIPQRWSVAHLYQAILNGESHVEDIAYITTLSGYVHHILTGNRVLGVGDASGMFPVDSATCAYDAGMLDKFRGLIAGHDYGWDIGSILPPSLSAGQDAGVLTPEGAGLLDPTGSLEAGIPLCPPEGDAGTGMVATNAVAKRTGNVSAGTSIFAMLVLEKALSKAYPEIDLVATPAGRPVAMVHCNNCTTDLDAWVRLAMETLGLFGTDAPKDDVYNALYAAALRGEKDCGGLLSYNYFSGEHMTGFEEGRPLLIRKPDARFNLPNLMRSLLFSSMTTLRIGMDVLTGEENVRVDCLVGHGGLFKTKDVAQPLMASALGVPVSVMETAGEGGAWGIALLAAYMGGVADAPLEDWLTDKVFADAAGSIVYPDAEDAAGFEKYLSAYKEGFAAERAAVEYA